MNQENTILQNHNIQEQDDKQQKNQQNQNEREQLKQKYTEILSHFDLVKELPTEANPHNVDSYPYGYKRTKARYWQESRADKGDRLVFQTLNPVTQRWNKPKKSTYSTCMNLGIEKSTGHFKHIFSFSYYGNINEYEIKKELLVDYPYNEIQKENLRKLYAMMRTNEHFTVTVRTREYRHKVTGEIKTSLSVFELNDYEEVKEAEEEEKKKEAMQEAQKIYGHYYKEVAE